MKKLLTIPAIWFLIVGLFAFIGSFFSPVWALVFMSVPPTAMFFNMLKVHLA